MAKRSEVTLKREAMQAALKLACISRELAPDEALASVRDLAEKYNVSPQIAWRAVQNLVEEGVLYTVPRMGTFVARPNVKEVELYLLIFFSLVPGRGYKSQIQMGFEEHIAQLGGVSLMLTTAEARDLLKSGALQSVKGVFEVETSDLTQKFEAVGVPSVYFGSLGKERCADAIHFNDIDGGAQATRHLLKTGHRRIAFLGIHRYENETGTWQWSADRETGWRSAMSEVRGATDLVFRAPSLPSEFEVSPDDSEEWQISSAYAAGMSLALHKDVDAVVVANGHAIQGLFRALRDLNIAPEQWPSVVGFDDDPMISGAVVSYLRLPWELIGRNAAEVLHGRAHKKMQSARQQWLVPMRLIPRLSCREQWTSTPGLVGRLSTGNIVKNSTNSTNIGNEDLFHHLK